MACRLRPPFEEILSALFPHDCWNPFQRESEASPGGFQFFSDRHESRLRFAAFFQCASVG